MLLKDVSIVCYAEALFYNSYGKGVCPYLSHCDSIKTTEARITKFLLSVSALL